MDQRVVRLFVSSTLRDMQGEREVLIKHVFPKLRKLCEARGVNWSEVDLRWGITEEQARTGQVIPICLAEVDNCPYFIGILGDRYGSVMGQFDEQLLEGHPWLSGFCGRSVTELEILHGVLLHPEKPRHAFFYFRDPGSAEEFRAESQVEADRQNDLKERLRQTHRFVVHENYNGPEALGQLVLEDLTGLIERLYPRGTAPDPLDREEMEHWAFAQSRLRIYIERKDSFGRLDEHTRGNGPPLVVLGESGSGKSALLANWALHYQQAHPDVQVLVHFIGATAYSADWTRVVRRILGELRRRFGLTASIPDEPDALRNALAKWLPMAAARGKIVLVLDALNQLEDRDSAPDLLWLPSNVPARSLSE